jgi:hypothetical protein
MSAGRFTDEKLTMAFGSFTDALIDMNAPVEWKSDMQGHMRGLRMLVGEFQ